MKKIHEGFCTGPIPKRNPVLPYVFLLINFCLAFQQLCKVDHTCHLRGVSFWKKIAHSFFNNSDGQAMMMALTFLKNKLMGAYLMVFATKFTKMVNTHVPQM